MSDNIYSVVDQVREVMASVFGMDESEINDDIAQKNCGRWSSLYHMTLLVALEDRFNTTFSMEEMPNMVSLAEIVSVLETRKCEAGL